MMGKYPEAFLQPFYGVFNMHTLFDSAQGSWNWFVYQKHATAKGAQIALDADGKIGRHFSAAESLAQLNVTIEFQSDSQAELSINLHPYYVKLNTRCFNQSYISRTLHVFVLTRCENLRILVDQTNRLTIRYANGEICVSLNGQKMSFRSAYRPDLSRFEFYTSKSLTLRRLHLEGSEHPNPIIVKPVDKLAIHTVFDFSDDIMTAPCGTRELDELMKANANLDVKRIYWSDFGELSQGFWNSFYYFNAEKTFSLLGDHVRASCEAAHKNGMEYFTILRPFDMHVSGLTFAWNSELARKYGKQNVMDGQAVIGLNFPLEHPELCMRRRHADLHQNPPSKIVVTSLKPIPTNTLVTLWCSDDNGTYQPSAAEVRVEGHQIVIENFDANRSFYAIETPVRRNYNGIFNEIQNLVAIYDKADNRMEGSLSFHPRTFRDMQDWGNHSDRINATDGDFRKGGFFFDNPNFGMPNVVYPGISTRITCAALDNSFGVVGVTCRKNSHISGCMSPAQPEAREFWFQLIQHALECNVDGVDIRVSSHLNILEWDQYGFEQPVVEAYKKRFGVDILTQPYDARNLRMIRGEFYTEFLKQASELVHRYDKKFIVHICDMMEGTPDTSTVMEMHWDWQNWLATVAPDEVTFKAFVPDGYDTYFGRELIAACRQRNIKVNFSPWLHCMEDYAKINDMARFGCNAFLIYENATVFGLKLDGTVTVLQPKLIDVLKKLKVDQR